MTDINERRIITLIGAILQIQQVVHSDDIATYSLACPSQSHWKIMSRAYCDKEDQYSCLLDIHDMKHKQKCKWTRICGPGYKYIWQSNFNRLDCDSNRYQPFIFNTTGYSDCVYRKSFCSSEGQLTASHGTSISDTLCVCDISRSYEFVASSKKNCIPSIEDCSCFQSRFDLQYDNNTYFINQTNIKMAEVSLEKKRLRYNNFFYNLKLKENFRNTAKWCVCTIFLLMVFVVLVFLIVLRILTVIICNQCLGWYIDLKINKQSDSLIDNKVCVRCSSQKTLLQLLFAENDEKILEYVSVLKTNTLLKENELNRMRDYFKRNKNLKLREFAYKVILKKKNTLDIIKCTELFYSRADPKIPRDVTIANQPHHNFIKDYFIEQTKMIQKMKYVEHSKYFKELSLQTLETIQNKYLYQGKLMSRICDKYIMLEALSIDILTNETDKIKLSNPLLNIPDKECILKRSSNPVLLRCMLLVRRAVICSFYPKKINNAGETMISDIFQMMASSQSCIEHVDILYRIVIFQRALFVSSSDKVTTHIEKLLDKAKCILKRESNDVKLHAFWETRFSIRLLFCYLGMGMRGVFIENYIITDDIKEKASKLIVFCDSKHSPSRMKMLFNMAKARYFDLNGDTEKAIKFNNIAYDIAERGNYNEKTAIIENRKQLGNRWRLTSDSNNINILECLESPNMYL